jgi:hypothetical protein
MSVLRFMQGRHNGETARVDYSINGQAAI